MSWSVLFLIGGGFAMASGVQSSGLDTVVMNALKHLDGIPPFFLLLIIVCVVGKDHRSTKKWTGWSLPNYSVQKVILKYLE